MNGQARFSFIVDEWTYGMPEPEFMGLWRDRQETVPAGMQDPSGNHEISQK